MELYRENRKKTEEPSWGTSITEQPRRHGSSVRCVRDPMTQGYWPWGVVEHVIWRQESRLGTQDRSSLFLIIP